MAEETQGRGGFGRGDYSKRQPQWRERGERGGYQRRDDRRGGYDRGADRDYQRRDGERRDFGGRDDARGERGGYQRRDDRRGSYQRRDGDRGFQRRDNDRREFGGRDDRHGGYDRGGYQRRDDRRGGFDDRGERGGFRREDRGRGGYQRRDDRRGGFRDDRRDGRGPRGNDRRKDANYQNYSSTEEYVSPNGNEPTIPAGVSAQELDADAARALTTLSGPNRDIVARHLVMAGQLIDLDPEAAYQHAQAAVSRAGRVDVVREAAALTAYASGRYEEALREVRAVRRMRGDESLRAVEADAERGLGHPEKAVEIIDATDSSALDLAEQVELVLVSSGARADLGQSDVGLVIVDDALAALPASAEDELRRRLMAVKAERLTELGRTEEAEEVIASMPEEVEDTDIIDVALYQDADVDNKRSPLRGSETALAEEFDCALLDLDGTAWSGDERIEHAASSVIEARTMGMASAFVTNNAMRTPQQVADKLNGMDFEATPDMVMTSAMDIAAIMAEELEEGAKVFVLGGPGLRLALEERGFELVDSADDEPAAVVQGLDKEVNWTLLSEGAFAIERGAAFYASNLDATLPVERGQALGHGSLVRAPRGQRPAYLAIDMRGLLESHPAPKHHRDGTWTCGLSQVAKVTRAGVLTLDDIELTDAVTISIDSYRALAAAAWEWADGSGNPVTCPEITVVANDDPSGIVTAPEPVADADDEFIEGADADALPEPGEDTPAFLPGEEELEALLESTADMDDEA